MIAIRIAETGSNVVSVVIVTVGVIGKVAAATETKCRTGIALEIEIADLIGTKMAVIEEAKRKKRTEAGKTETKKTGIDLGTKIEIGDQIEIGGATKTEIEDQQRETRTVVTPLGAVKGINPETIAIVIASAFIAVDPGKAKMTTGAEAHLILPLPRPRPRPLRPLMKIQRLKR